MTKSEKKSLDEMLNGFESALAEFESCSDPVSMSEIASRIESMNQNLASIPLIIEA